MVTKSAKLAAKRAAAKTATATATKAKPTTKAKATTTTTTPTKARTRKGAAKTARKATTAKATTKAAARRAKKTTSAPAEANDHKAQARQMFEDGSTRREISESMGLAYATIYAHTSDMQDAAGATAGRARVFVEVDGEQVSRSSAMRTDFTDGMSIGDIGRKYGVIYQVAYQAVKTLIVRDDD